MPKIEPRKPSSKGDRSLPKLPVTQSDNAQEGYHTIAPGGRLQNNSVVINGTEYELESLLRFLVSKVDHSA